MAFEDVKLGEQIADGLTDHCRTIIGVQGEAMPIHALFGDGVINQGFGDISAFTLRKSPSNDVTTEDIDDHVQLEVHPFLWAEQLGDVPTPGLIGCRRAEFRLDPRRMRCLAAAFAYL